MENHMILSTIRMTIPTQKRGKVIKILRLLAEQRRNENCCLSCCIYEDVQEKNVLMLEEVWDIDADLDLHACSSEYRELLQVLETAPKQPEIGGGTILKSTGIETVENIRCRA
jgi:quinol monooxygenase YgiN